ESAAAMVRQPVRIQVSSKPPAEPVWRAMSAATMKMPEPIMEPTTIIVPSNKPMAFTNSCSLLPACVEIALVASAIPVRASVVSRGLRGFQSLDKFPRARRRVFRQQNVADHGHGIRACFEHFGRAFQGDAANGHDRLPGHRTYAAHEVRAD